MAPDKALLKCYVLHARSYRETSLLVDCFTLEMGKVALIAKGAKRGKSKQSNALQSFVPLGISLFGRGDLYSLRSVEELGRGQRLTGERLACALYLNELLMYLLPREEPMPALFAFYAQALSALAEESSVAPVLRGFELCLLEQLGVAPDWGRVAGGAEAVVAEGFYAIGVDGPYVQAGAQVAQISGATFLSLARAEPVTAESRRVLRYFLDLQLGGRELKSRELLRGPGAMVN